MPLAVSFCPLLQIVWGSARCHRGAYCRREINDVMYRPTETARYGWHDTSPGGVTGCTLTNLWLGASGCPSTNPFCNGWSDVLYWYYSRRVTKRAFSWRHHSRGATRLAFSWRRYSLAQTQYPIAQTRSPIAPFHVSLAQAQYPIAQAQYPIAQTQYPIAQTRYSIAQAQYSIAQAQSRKLSAQLRKLSTQSRKLSTQSRRLDPFRHLDTLSSATAPHR